MIKIRDGVMRTSACARVERFARVAIASGSRLWNSVRSMNLTHRNWAPLLALATWLAWPTAASAQDLPTDGACPPDVAGCHYAEVDFHHRDALFDDVMFDTGWVPSGAPVQVRFGVFLGGSTEVDLGGTVFTSWPAGLEVAVPGRPLTGRFAVNYGLEVVARIRFDVSVAGVRYTWEGDIPIPGGIPRDLRLADDLIFDPFVLPPRDPRPVLVWDDTDVVTVLDVDLTDAIIPIPGIGGGFLVDAVGELEGRYQTDSIDLSDAIAPIVEEDASTLVRPDPGAVGFGAAKDLTVLPHGTIGYEGIITLLPRLYIEILGRRFDLTLAEIPVDVVDRSTDTDFNTAEVHVPLPDVRVDPTNLVFGEVMAGASSELLLTIANDGEAELAVSLRTPSAPFSVASPSAVIPPSSSVRIAVRFDPVDDGSRSGVLLLDTNDPDTPLVTVRLNGNGFGAFDDAGLADGGVGDGGYGTMDGGCGCRTVPTSSTSPAWAAVGLLALALVRRRRR
jgi:MYXO-CTERM domain-containing protein